MSALAGASSSSGSASTRVEMLGKEGRAHRHETTVQIRKQKRRDALSKRRTSHLATHETSPMAGGPHASPTTTVDLNAVAEVLKHGKQSEEVTTQQLNASRALLGMLQANCACVLALIAAEDSLDGRNSARADASASPQHLSAAAVLVRDTKVLQGLAFALGSSASVDLQCSALWCLGNMAADSHTVRSHLIAANLLKPIIESATVPQPETLKHTALRRQAVFALANLCRGFQPCEAMTPELIRDTCSRLCSTLCVLTNSCSGDAVAVADVLHGLHLLTRNSDEAVVDMLISAGVLSSKTLAKVILNPPEAVPGIITQDDVITAAIKVAGNIAGAADRHTDLLVQSASRENVAWLRKLGPMLKSPSKELKREVCWLISNIAATELGASVLVCKPHGPSFLSGMVEALTSTQWMVQREALFAVSNIILTIASKCQGHMSAILLLVDYDVLRPLMPLLHVNDADVVCVTLKVMDALLALGKSQERCSYFSSLTDEAGGVDELLKLQTHPNELIYRESVRLLETYFASSLEDDESMAMGSPDGAGGFTVTEFSFVAPEQGQGGIAATSPPTTSRGSTTVAVDGGDKVVGQQQVQGVPMNENLHPNV